MNISVVQRNAAASAALASFASAPFQTNNTLGNAIVVISFIAANISNLSISDTQGNSYTSLLSNYNVTDGLGFQVWIAYNIKAGANTVTVNNGTNASTIHIYELVAPNTTSAFDVDNYQYQLAATALSSNSATTNYPAELLLGASANLSIGGSYSLGSGYSNLVTAIGTAIQSATEEQSGVAVSAQSAGFSLSSNTAYTVTVMVTFGNSLLVLPVQDKTVTEEYVGIEIGGLPDLLTQDYTVTSESVGYYSELVATKEFITLDVAGETFGDSVSDSTVTSENVTLLLPFLMLAVSDSTTTSESVTKIVPTYFIGVTDSTVTSESVTYQDQEGIYVTDSTATSENINISIFSPTVFIAVSDSTVTSELITTPGLPVVASDTSITSESVGYYSELVATKEVVQFTTYYTLNLGDDRLFDEAGGILEDENGNAIQTEASSGDYVNNTEIVSGLIPTLFLSVSDTTVTSEYIAADGATIILSETTVTSENVNVVAYKPYPVGRVTLISLPLPVAIVIPVILPPTVSINLVLP